MLDDDHLIQALRARATGPAPYEAHRGDDTSPPPAPLTTDQITQVEAELAFPLPELLRRIYTEVGNGDFGPGAYGLHPLTDGDDNPTKHWGSWPSVLAAHRRERGRGRPDWLCLAYDGCSVYWYLALTEPDYPVYYFDWDRIGSDHTDLSEGIIMIAPSLREWLWAWLEGEELFTAWTWVGLTDAEHARLWLDAYPPEPEDHLVPEDQVNLVGEADRKELLEWQLGPEIRRIFRRVVEDRLAAGRVATMAELFYDTRFGPFRDDGDFLGFFYNEVLHQDTCVPSTAGGVELVAWLAVDDRVPARDRMNLVEFLFFIATVGQRHAAASWPEGCGACPYPGSEASARAAVQAVAAEVLARWDAECTAVRVMLAALAAACPGQAGPAVLRRVSALAEQLRGTPEGDLLDLAAVMVDGAPDPIAEVVNHHRDHPRRGAADEPDLELRAIGLMEQMCEAVFSRLITTLPPEPAPQ